MFFFSFEILNKLYKTAITYEIHDQKFFPQANDLHFNSDYSFLT